MVEVREPRKSWHDGILGDEIGPWSEVKLEIIKRYAAEYSKILTAQKTPPLKHLYIDAFAGSGLHFSRTSREFVPGSPLNALLVEPPFREYHFIELRQQKVEVLHEIAGDTRNVFVHPGDCNRVLLEEVFPRARYEDYARALCLLDPYGLQLDWEVVRTAGSMKSLEIFLNFPTMDINRNVLRKKREEVVPEAQSRMTAFWGDETWVDIAYEQKQCLFGPYDEKVTNEMLAEGFRERLRQIAGFSYVPKPCPMKNSRGAVLYYLFFASQNSAGDSIISHIFKKFGGVQ